MSNEGLWLNEAILKFDKKLYKGHLNIINAPAGSGKSSFIFKEFLEESYKYVDFSFNKKYIDNLDRVLYVCDTNMLKSSILNEKENKYITKVLEKGDLKRAMKGKSLKSVLEGDVGYIKVITYSTFGWLLQQESSKYILLNYFNVIIMDEMHNLFKYANRFDNEENNKPYGTAIENLPCLVDKTLVVALSATTGRINNGIRNLDLKTNTIFSLDELKEIKKYNNKSEIETNDIMNQLKYLALYANHFITTDKKVMIYTNTVKQSKRYKEFFENIGLKAEWLCSINNTFTNENGEKIPRMKEGQIKLRSQLIETGLLPDDLDVFIINSGYETGWNLKDSRLQYVYIDSIDEDTHIQARNRIRHDITLLVTKVRTTSWGEVIEYGYYREDMYTGRCITMWILASKIEEKYIGVKLTAKDKKYLVDKYALRWYDQDNTTWKTFKKDLDKCGFIVKTYKNDGTYIFRKGSEYKKDVKPQVDKLLIDWIENEWDKKRITCQDVMDILDIGRKSFNKMIEDEEIVNYFKENRYKIGNIKNSKTKYLMKY